jgi:penicillin-binding protein 1A
MIAGVYMGFDQPRNMGGYAQGGTMAAPIFRDFAKQAMAGMPKKPFVAPRGIRLVRIDRRTGRRVYGGFPSNDPESAVIWDVFKPETEPRRSVRREELLAQLDARKAQAKAAALARLRARQQSRRASSDTPQTTRSDSDFLNQEGGIY